MGAGSHGDGANAAPRRGVAVLPAWSGVSPVNPQRAERGDEGISVGSRPRSHRMTIPRRSRTVTITHIVSRCVIGYLAPCTGIAVSHGENAMSL